MNNELRVHGLILHETILWHWDCSKNVLCDVSLVLFQKFPDSCLTHNTCKYPPPPPPTFPSFSRLAAGWCVVWHITCLMCTINTSVSCVVWHVPWMCCVTRDLLLFRNSNSSQCQHTEWWSCCCCAHDQTSCWPFRSEATCLHNR